MRMLGRRVFAFLSRQSAQTFGEYSLLISLVAVLVIVASVITFRDAMFSTWESVAELLEP
jgi:Flp pilus assembly pilin Flp